MKKEIDWMGLWYQILKERGENDIPTLGILNLKTNLITWYRFSHSLMDGIGAINQLYLDRQITLSALPALKEKSPPNFFERIIIFYRLLTTFKKIPTDWIEKNLELKCVDPHRLAWIVFSKEETRALESYCLNNKISICAHLMNISSKILLKELSINQAGTWVLPVNLRPVLKRQDFSSNHSSGILIPIKKNDPQARTHQLIKSALKNKEHWGIWWAHQIGKYIGYRAMKFISHHNSKKNFLAGSFSYFGYWNLPPDEICIGGPPGSKNFPLSIMAMIAQEQLIYCLKVHPYIQKDETKTPILLDLIYKEILKVSHISRLLS